MTFQIGQNYGGGIIFYIDGTGQYGLIAAESDQAEGAEWGCAGTLIGGTSTAIGTGQANTTAIVNGCDGSGFIIAARLCYDLVLNGYDDWFLPSKDELIQGLAAGVFPGFHVYWSSSEVDANRAWAYYGNIYEGGKDNEIHGVRAIRAF